MAGNAVNYFFVDRIGIAVAGGSCSGKTTLAERLALELGATLLRVDDYYYPLDDISYERRCDINFDEPNSIDHALLVEQVRALLEGRMVDAPRYDFTRHTRFSETQPMEAPEVLVVEGLFTLCYQELVDLCSVRIFVDAPEDVCLQRRIDRDTRERGRTPGEVISRFHGHVAPMYRQHIEPTRALATIVVSGQDGINCSLARVLESLQAHSPLSASEDR